MNPCSCTQRMRVPVKPNDYFYYFGRRCVCQREQCVRCGFIHLTSCYADYLPQVVTVTLSDRAAQDMERTSAYHKAKRLLEEREVS